MKHNQGEDLKRHLGMYDKHSISKNHNINDKVINVFLNNRLVINYLHLFSNINMHRFSAKWMKGC